MTAAARQLGDAGSPVAAPPVTFSNLTLPAAGRLVPYGAYPAS